MGLVLGTQGPAITGVGQIATADLADGAVTTAKAGTWPACSVASAVGTSVPNLGGGTYTPLACELEYYDTESMHSTVTNNSRITIVTAGVYAITTYIIMLYANTTGFRFGFILLNGATELGAARSIPSTSQLDHLTVVSHKKLIVGDYVQSAVTQTSGQAITVYPTLSAHWLGKG